MKGSHRKRLVALHIPPSSQSLHFGHSLASCDRCALNARTMRWEPARLFHCRLLRKVRLCCLHFYLILILIFHFRNTSLMASTDYTFTVFSRYFPLPVPYFLLYFTILGYNCASRGFFSFKLPESFFGL